MTNDEEIRRSDEESEMGTRLAYFLIGGGIGAIVALLLRRSRVMNCAATSPT
ncbi:MAG: hypothetical protein WKF30_14355 [Pyrinomonadaceae bacterium]